MWVGGGGGGGGMRPNTATSRSLLLLLLLRPCQLLLQHGSVTVAVSVRVLELVACISGIASDCTICWQLP